MPLENFDALQMKRAKEQQRYVGMERIHDSVFPRTKHLCFTSRLCQRSLFHLCFSSLSEMQKSLAETGN